MALPRDNSKATNYNIKRWLGQLLCLKCLLFTSTIITVAIYIYVIESVFSASKLFWTIKGVITLCVVSLVFCTLSRILTQRELNATQRNPTQAKHKQNASKMQAKRKQNASKTQAKRKQKPV